MQDDSTATDSAKTGTGTTPFDAIVACEQEQASRITEAEEALRNEEEQVKADMEKRVHEQEQNLKKEANEKLNTFKAGEPQTILTNGKKAAETLQDSLSKQAESKKKAIVTDLVEQFLTLKV